MTRYDVITHFNIDELAKFIDDKSSCACCTKEKECKGSLKFPCREGIKEWLQKEIEVEL